MHSEQRNNGMKENWNDGVVERKKWNIGMLEYWKIGMIEVVLIFDISHFTFFE